MRPGSARFFLNIQSILQPDNVLNWPHLPIRPARHLRLAQSTIVNRKVKFETLQYA
jgi:hypothetical protein